MRFEAGARRAGVGPDGPRFRLAGLIARGRGAPNRCLARAVIADLRRIKVERHAAIAGLQPVITQGRATGGLLAVVARLRSMVGTFALVVEAFGLEIAAFGPDVCGQGLAVR